MPSVNHSTTALPPLIAIVGPTAVGKTAIAIRLCEVFGGEVVSADSRQVYRDMDIGTAKPTWEERRRVPHHLIDILDPDQILTLAEFQARAYAAVNEIAGRARVPFLVGGTGQYVLAVVEGWTVPEVAPDWELRERWYAEAREAGAGALHARLAVIDPVAAARIDPRNVRRVIRALEVFHATGQPISAAQCKVPPPYRILMVGLTLPRELLYHRIDERIDEMIRRGLVAEVQRLVDQHYAWDLPSMSGLGYGEIGRYLRGEVSLDEAIRLIKRNTRRFVRQQYNWFHLSDTRIRWFDLSRPSGEAVEACVREFLSDQFTWT